MSNEVFTPADIKKSSTMKYPPCWEDDERMNVLMSPFRPRSVNEENYDSKLQFWKDMIKCYLEFIGSPIFNKPELIVAFTRKNRTPYDLDKVIDSMRQNVEIRLKTEYMYDPNNTWTGWALNSFVRKPIVWGFSKIYFKSENSLPDFVHLESARELTDKLDKILRKFAGKILEFPKLAAAIEPFICLNNDGLEICLHNLLLQKKVFIDYDIKKEIKLIKIPGNGNQSAEITDADKVVFKLDKLKTDISTQLNKMEEEIKRIDNLVRQNLREGKKSLAKSYLRRKHFLEKCLENRSLTLHNIETLLVSVEEAQDNGELLNAFTLATKVLKELNDSKDSAEIMDDVQDVIGKQREIQETISTSYLDNENFDVDELEKELESIMSEKDTITIPSSSTNDIDNRNNNNKHEISYQELLQLLEGLETESVPVKNDNTNIKENVTNM